MAFAEETGQIVPVGCWVLAAACRQMAQWQSELRVDVSMAVNLLQRYPFDWLKIDRSFVTALGPEGGGEELIGDHLHVSRPRRHEALSRESPTSPTCSTASSS